MSDAAIVCEARRICDPPPTLRRPALGPVRGVGVSLSAVGLGRLLARQQCGPLTQRCEVRPPAFEPCPAARASG